MGKKRRDAKLPDEAITLSTYAELDLYLSKIAAGELGLVLLVGRHGTGKSESVKQAFRGAIPSGSCAATNKSGVLYVEGHLKPFGLYRQLWDFRDCPVVLDDLDRLYADSDCVRLLKPLCNTERVKRLTWLTRSTLNADDVPMVFTTSSSVVLIANEWRTINPNVRALEDRAIILHFDPTNAELHRRVGEWFDDPEVYEYIAGLMPFLDNVSMRHYRKGSQLRRAGLPNWRTSLLQMLLPDPRLACIASLQNEQEFLPESAKVERFTTTTGYSRATYFRAKARLVRLRAGHVFDGRLDNSA